MVSSRVPNGASNHSKHCAVYTVYVEFPRYNKTEVVKCTVKQRMMQIEVSNIVIFKSHVFNNMASISQTIQGPSLLFHLFTNLWKFPHIFDISTTEIRKSEKILTKSDTAFALELAVSYQSYLEVPLLRRSFLKLQVDLVTSI